MSTTEKEFTLRTRSFLKVPITKEKLSTIHANGNFSCFISLPLNGEKKIFEIHIKPIYAEYFIDAATGIEEYAEHSPGA